MATQEQKIVLKDIEDVLYSYPKYKNRIKEETEHLANPQLKKYCGVGGQGKNGYEIKSEYEQIEELKQRISNNISRYREMLFRIDECLNMVKDNKDYKFIELKYFQGLTYEEIAEKLEVHVTSTYKMRNRILGALKVHFKAQKLIEF